MVIGRFAPSPTGPLHLGSLVAAVGSYCMAKRSGGRWLVRMEDLDTPRVVTGCADDILRTLEALGFEWDGEVVYQSRRGEAYQQALDLLVSRGVVYPCGCSRAEIARSATAPHDGEGELPYPGTCSNGLPPGKTPRAWRVRVPDEPLVFGDMILGEQRFELSGLCGDFVVKRADGLFAYQLAVVVDDEWQGVNQVVRGSDLLTSTPRQLHLLNLLGVAPPEYAHLPLVTAADGGKLSKRDNRLSIASAEGLCANPAVLIASALSFLGQSLPEYFADYSSVDLLTWGAKHFVPAAIPHFSAPCVLQR